MSVTWASICGTETNIFSSPNDVGEGSGVIWHPRLDKCFWVDDGGTSYGAGTWMGGSGGSTSSGRLCSCDADGTNRKWLTVGGDLEDITYADPAGDYIYILAESQEQIYEISLTAWAAAAHEGSVAKHRTWDISGLDLIDDGVPGAGPEGMTFIPAKAGVDHADVIAEGGCFAIGSQRTGSQIRYVLLRIVTSSSDTTVTELNQTNYSGSVYYPANKPGGREDIGGMAFDRAHHRMIVEADYYDELYVVRPYPNASNVLTVVETITATNPDSTGMWEGWGLDEENGRTWAAKDEGRLSYWPINWAQFGAITGTAAVTAPVAAETTAIAAKTGHTATLAVTAPVAAETTAIAATTADEEEHSLVPAPQPWTGSDTSVLPHGLRKISFSWEVEAPGVISIKTESALDGKILAFHSIPTAISGGSYDVTVLDDDGHDVLMGAGIGLSGVSNTLISRTSLGAVANSRLTTIIHPAFSGDDPANGVLSLIVK